MSIWMYSFHIHIAVVAMVYSQLSASTCVDYGSLSTARRRELIVRC